jgi:hypothetical protein
MNSYLIAFVVERKLQRQYILRPQTVATLRMELCTQVFVLLMKKSLKRSEHHTIQVSF